MSNRLLQGWTMLHESCPTCQVPLMRPKTEKLLMSCLQCNIDYLKPSDFDPSKHKLASAAEATTTTTEAAV
jgi:uncharacterized Zn finger protein (UPF0148 family)